MTYTLIGSGNMAWFLAGQMIRAGHACVGQWGRNYRSSEELCAYYHLPRLGSLSDVHDGPELCILAVSDSAIPEVASQLSLRYTTLVHTAGSQPLSLIQPFCRHAGVLWPVYSIRRDDLPAHRHFPVVLEASDETALHVLQNLAQSISDIQHEVSGPQRSWLHLSAVVGNNFVNHLLTMISDICREQGLPQSLLQPLLEQTLNTVGKIDPRVAQTGPAKRHDGDTLQMQHQMLKAWPEWQSIYDLMSESIMTMFPKPPRG